MPSRDSCSKRGSSRWLYRHNYRWAIAPQAALGGAGADVLPDNSIVYKHYSGTAVQRWLPHLDWFSLRSIAYHCLIFVSPGDALCIRLQQRTKSSSASAQMLIKTL